MFGGNFAIRGFAQCDGQTMNIVQNQALFSLLGTIYGGDGRTTFKLPDLRSRSPKHKGQGPGLPSYNIGTTSGNYQHTLTTQEMPPHGHVVRMACNGNDANSDDPIGGFLGVTEENLYSTSSNERMGPTTSESVGNGRSFNIENPFVAINFQIALVGVYPSRN